MFENKEEALIGNDFISPHNREEVVQQLEKIIRLGVDFKLRQFIGKSASYEELYDIFDEKMPSTGQSLPNLISLVENKIFPYSTNFASPYAMAFPDAGNSTAAIAGALLSDFINQNLINWHPCAPAGTVIEIIVLNWIRELIGYDVIDKPTTPMDVGGVITTGGVSSNTIAQLIAREIAIPKTMTNGLHGAKNEIVSIIPNGIDHYSTRLSMGWLGLGENSIIHAPTEHFKYDIAKLSSIMHELHKQGKKIMSLTAYAGDSRSMTCDDFVRLRELCDTYNTWFHVDGCHGTQLLFSEKLKSKVRGIELADSVTLDPHKVLNVPYVASILILRNPSNIMKIQRPEDIITGEDHSFGQITPFFGSRSFLSLKLYLLIKNLGKSGLGAIIECRHETARLLASKIIQNKNFTLINPKVDINSVIFLYNPEDMQALKNTDANLYLKKLNKLNAQIHTKLLNDGKIWLHNFNIPDLSNALELGSNQIIRPLRYMSGNPLVTEQHLDEMLAYVEEYGSKILKEETA